MRQLIETTDDATCRKPGTAAAPITVEHVINREARKMDRRYEKYFTPLLTASSIDYFEALYEQTVLTTLSRGVYINRPKGATTTADGYNDSVERDKVCDIENICKTSSKLEMWANALHDVHPAEHRRRPLFNAAKCG